MAKSLEEVLSYEYVNLRVLTNEQAAARPAGADSWSRKEELGHLIDSAVNNHLRFTAASPASRVQRANLRTRRLGACPRLSRDALVLALG